MSKYISCTIINVVMLLVVALGLYITGDPNVLWALFFNVATTGIIVSNNNS